MADGAARKGSTPTIAVGESDHRPDHLHMIWGPDTLPFHLSPERCEEQLRSSQIRRLGAFAEGQPLMFPSVRLGQWRIVFLSNVATKRHSSLNWPFLAFEICWSKRTARQGGASWSAGGWQGHRRGRRGSACGFARCSLAQQ